MNNNQYNPNIYTPTNYYSNAQPTKPSNLKFKLILAGLISIMVIGLLILIALIINKNQSPLVTTREVTPTLQIYASLPDEMPISDIEKTIQKIDNNAEVTLDEGYGTIKIPDTNEVISFYYLYEDANEDENEETSDQTNLETETIEENLTTEEVGNDAEEETAEIIYQPDIAYEFTYLYEMGEYNLYISKTSDNLYQCYDGSEVFDFSTKEEAINAFLTPSAE